MNRWMASCMALIILTATATTTRAQTSARDGAPQTLVERIIAYERAGASDDATFLDFFTPGLRRLILADRKAAADQDAPYLDGDPFCDCQDNEGLVMRIVSVSRHESEADALIRNHFEGSGDADRHVTLRLRMTKTGWRVDDVATREQPSLRAGLRDALQRH